MSIKGSSYGRFRLALDSGDLAAVQMTALELPYVNLADALAVCLLMRRARDPRFERAAVRWLARISLERPEITLGEVRVAAAALVDLPSARSRVALTDLATGLRLPDVERVLRTDASRSKAGREGGRQSGSHSSDRLSR